MEWKAKKLMERRRAEKRIKRKATKIAKEEAEKRHVKLTESSKTFESWQVRTLFK